MSSFALHRDRTRPWWRAWDISSRHRVVVVGPWRLIAEWRA